MTQEIIGQNFNCETKEITPIYKTPEYDAYIAEISKAEIERSAAETAKAAERQTLLTRLGITDNEAKLLLGGN